MKTQMRKLIATKSLRYDTRRLMAGDVFEANDMHARVLIAVRKARLAPEKEKKLPTVKPAPPPQEDDIDSMSAQAAEPGKGDSRRAKSK